MTREAEIAMSKTHVGIWLEWTSVHFEMSQEFSALSKRGEVKVTFVQVFPSAPFTKET